MNPAETEHVSDHACFTLLHWLFGFLHDGRSRFGSETTLDKSCAHPGGSLGCCAARPVDHHLLSCLWDMANKPSLSPGHQSDSVAQGEITFIFLDIRRLAFDGSSPLPDRVGCLI